MNIEINKFQIIQFIKMCSNKFKPTELLTDVRNKQNNFVCERTKNNYCCVNGSPLKFKALKFFMVKETVASLLF